MSNARELSDLVSAAPSTDASFDGGTLYIDRTNNRVGIGTSSPATALDVNGNIIIADSGTIGSASATGAITISAAGVSTISSLVATTADINGGTIDGVTLGTNSAVTEAQVDDININNNTISTTNTDVDIILSPNGSGNVGIGTTSPSEKLTLGSGSSIGIERTTGVSPSLSFASDNDTDFSIEARNATLSGVAKQKISFVNEDTFSRKGIAFYTTNAVDATTAGVERMRIDSGGNVGIGTSSPESFFDVRTTGETEQIVADFSSTGDGSDRQRLSIIIDPSTQTTELYGGAGGGSDNNTNLAFSIRDGVNGRTERMRITSAGQLLYAAGVYASSKRVSGVRVNAGATETLFNLWNGSQGAGHYLVSISRNGGNVASRSLAIVASSTSTISVLYSVLDAFSLTIGVSGSSVTVTNTAGGDIFVNAIAIPLVIEGN